MTRTKPIFMAGTLSLLGACASLIDEASGRITVDGVWYETRIRTYARPDGSTFQSKQVLFNGRGYYCNDQGSASCEKTVRALLAGHHLNHPGNEAPSGLTGGGYTPPGV